MKGERRKTILLVDDEAIIAMNEKATLERYGYAVIIAHSGEAAVTAVEKTPAIDLILMDINLGAGMDGTEAAAAILKNRDLPVVFLSSHLEPEIVAKTEKITSYGYVVKDSSATVLDASIKMAFKLFEARIKELEKEDALRESEEWNKLILDTVLSGVMVIEANTRTIIDVNDTAQKLIGLPKEQIVGAVCHRFVCPAEEKSCPVLDLGKKVDLSEKILLMANGKQKNIIKTVVAVELQGHPYLIESFVDITQRKQAESQRETALDALQASEAHTQAMLRTIPDMLFRIDRQGVFLDYKADSKDLYAQSEPTIIGKRNRDIVPADFADLIDRKIQATLETGTLQTFEYQLPIPGRGVRDYEARMAASGADEVTAIVRDITEQKLSESQREAALEALQKSEERLRDILFSMADWVWEVDEKGVYTYSSEKGETLLGAAHENIIGKTLFDFMPADEAKRAGAIFSEIAANKLPIIDLENWIIGKNGERICLLTNGVPIIDAAGNLKGYRGVGKDISERKRAEEVIENGLKFQQALMDAVPSPIFYKDAQCVYIGGNKAFEQYIGLTREQFIGKTVYDISPADLAREYDQADRELLENKGVQTYETSVVYADGRRRNVVFNKAVFTAAQGDVAGLIGVILDITEMKRSERLTAALFGISQAIFTSRDLDELYQRIHGYIAAIVPADNFFIALLADEGRALEFPYYRDEKDASQSDIIRADDAQSLTVEVLRTKKPLFLDEAQLRDRYATGRSRVWGTAPKCWLGVPLLIRDEVIGVMVIQDYHEGGAYGQKDVALLESTAGQVAIAIDRKRTEKALHESVEAFRGYFNMGTVGVSVSSPEKGWIEVNDCLCRMLGYTREELLRLTWAEMTHADDLNADLTLFNQVVAGQRDAYELEKRFIRKDGQVIHTLLNVTCQRNPDGTVHHFLVSLVDISERKRAESQSETALAALRESEERYRTLIENASDFVYRTDKAGHFTFINRATLTITGYEERELIGKFYPTLIRPDMRNMAVKIFLHQIRKGTHNTYSEFPILTKDGREIWLGQNIQLVMQNGQVTGFQAVSRDITKSRQAEDALRESEEKYRTLVEKANEAIIIAQDGAFVFANRRMSDLVGVPAGALEGRPFIDFVWPDDRELVSTNYRKRIAGEPVRDAYDFRFIGAGGRLIWVFLSAAVIQWKGKPATLNLLTDITARKHAEELFQTVFENMGTALIIIEEDTIMSHVNAGMEKIWGYKKEEIEGLVKWPEMVAKEDLKKMLEYHLLRRIDPDSAPASYEFRLIHKTGELRDAALTAAMVPGTKKSVISIRDITERKQAEKEITQQLAEKEILLREVHHRIKNNIATIGGLISLRLQSVSNPEAVAVLKDAFGRIDSMRILYDKLLLSEGYKNIPVKNYVESLVDTIMALFPESAKVTLDKHISDFHLDSKRLFPLGIIINELLTNKMKYAFSGRKRGSIKIDLVHADNHVTLAIEDDGNRLPDGFDIHDAKGFGLMLVKMLSQQLRGSFSMENQAGTRCTVAFDI